MHRGADTSLLGAMRSQSPSVLQLPLSRASKWPPQAPALPRHSWAPASRPEPPLARGSAWPRDLTGQLTSPHKDPAHQPPRPPYPARPPTPKAPETCFHLVAGSHPTPAATPGSTALWLSQWPVHLHCLCPPGNTGLYSPRNWTGVRPL